MRALIDTCIVIDALQAREPFAEDAQQIFLAVANKRVMGFLTAKSAADIYYITHRHTHNDHETRRVLSTLFTPPKNYKISSAFSYNFISALTWFVTPGICLDSTARPMSIMQKSCGRWRINSKRGSATTMTLP